MKCMRCGNKIQAGAVFCESCLADMERYPVDPSTPIYLPRREKHVANKRSKKRALKPEEQLRRTRHLVVWLMAIILVLSIALAGAVYMLLNHPDNSNPNLLPGQNYGTETEATQTT